MDEWGEPPAGVPWPVWLLLILVGGPAGVAAILSPLAAQIPGAFGKLGRWWQGRQAARRAKLAQPDAAYVDDAEIGRLRGRYEQLAADAERDRTLHRREIEEVRGEIAELKRMLTVANSRLWAAVGHIRVLEVALRHAAPDRPIPAAPEKIRDLI